MSDSAIQNMVKISGLLVLENGDGQSQESLVALLEEYLSVQCSRCRA
jgi:hypothetical protein